MLWVRRGKDTLALGNITGAMVFQLLPLVAFGMVFTDWRLTAPALLAMPAALGGAAFSLITLRHPGGWPVPGMWRCPGMTAAMSSAWAGPVPPTGSAKTTPRSGPPSPPASGRVSPPISRSAWARSMPPTRKASARPMSISRSGFSLRGHRRTRGHLVLPAAVRRLCQARPEHDRLQMTTELAGRLDKARVERDIRR